MTDGERMIWAAAFSREFECHMKPPNDVLFGPTGAHIEWETQKALEAAENACHVVKKARAALYSAELEWEKGGDSDLLMFLRMMRG